MGEGTSNSVWLAKHLLNFRHIKDACDLFLQTLCLLLTWDFEVIIKFSFNAGGRCIIYCTKFGMGQIPSSSSLADKVNGFFYANLCSLDSMFLNFKCMYSNVVSAVC